MSRVARPGDRTVAVNGRRLRLQTPLATPGFHVLLEREAAMPDDLPSGPRVSVHRLLDVAGRGVVVVRPDGYIGMRAAYADEA